MSKKLVGFSPLLRPELANGLESVAHLLHKRLLGYQTVTMLFEGAESDSDPKTLPSLMVSRLPGEDWVLELPLPPINGEHGLGSKVEFFIFNDWMGPAEEIAGTFSCGPKKVIHEADSKSLSSAMLSAVEDLLLVSDRLEAVRILIADKQGEVTDSFGASLSRLLASAPDSIGILPATSSFFEESDVVERPTKEEVDRIARSFLEIDILMDKRSLNFYASTCYMGVPRNLFLLDYSTDELNVSVWNGKQFVECSEEHTVRAIRKQGKEPQPGGPKELPPIFVSNLWPDALRQLGLPLLRSDEEL